MGDPELKILYFLKGEGQADEKAKRGSCSSKRRQDIGGERKSLRSTRDPTLEEGSLTKGERGSGAGSSIR